MPDHVTAVIADHLRAEEGTVLHAYRDHLGFLTIGTGILIDERKGGSITAEENEYLLGNRIGRIGRQLDERLPWWREQPEAVQVALAAMAFQLGVGGLLGFPKMLGALRAGDREAAALEALDSKWAREDTPARAARVAAMIREG